MDVVLGGGEGGFGVGSAVADAGGGGAVLLVEARIARAAPEAENLDFVFELVSAALVTLLFFTLLCSGVIHRLLGPLRKRVLPSMVRRHC